MSRVSRCPACRRMLRSWELQASRGRPSKGLERAGRRLPFFGPCGATSALSRTQPPPPQHSGGAPQRQRWRGRLQSGHPSAPNPEASQDDGQGGAARHWRDPCEDPGPRDLSRIQGPSAVSRAPFGRSVCRWAPGSRAPLLPSTRSKILFRHSMSPTASESDSFAPVTYR